MIKSLQMGRGLAALAVAGFHLSIVFGDPRYGNTPVLQEYTYRGSLGVDFFFVLSGFIIAYAHTKDFGQGFRLPRYLLKRAIRVYPIYWVFTAFVLIGSAVTGGINQPPREIGDILSVVTLVRFTDYAAPIGVAWTLYHEILFYLVFALLIFNVRLGIAGLGIWLATLIANFHYSHHGQWNFANVVLSANNLSFFCGMAACVISSRIDGRLGAASVLVGLILVFVAHVSSLAHPEIDLFHFLFSVAFMLVIAGVVALEKSGRVRNVPMLSLIGNASYTLYLSHESVESSLLKIAARSGMMNMLDHRILYVIVMIATVVIALILFNLIERPMLYVLNGLFGLRPKRTQDVRRAEGGADQAVP